MADKIWDRLLKKNLQNQANQQVVRLPVDKIKPNPHQPRQAFLEEDLTKLAESIKTHGLLQPVIVTKSESEGSEYILVVGERRLRASILAGLSEVPAIIGTYSEQELAEVALVENLQRKDLSAIEEAKAYRDLLDRFGLTQSQLGERIGKSQSAIANKLRLLSLPAEVQEYISREIISERHARALLKLPPELVVDTAKQVVRRGLTVKQTEALVQRMLQEKTKQSKKVIRVFKDARLFRNSVLKLVKDLKAGGLNVKVSESEAEDSYSITINISKSNRGLN
ncbi:MAG: ParB/RepB/Spo0J family partition protein [Firmicutes bacterium]|nr:ParB/RepB/Spo0J family partition protein [Bacillota bacterium]